MYTENIVSGEYPYQICLGKQNEKNVRSFIFDCNVLENEFPNGSPELVILRPFESIPYFVTLENKGENKYQWTVNNYDTNRSGYGEAELRWYSGDALCKSIKIQTVIKESISVDAVAPPDPFISWVDRVLEASAEAKQSAESAKESEAKSAEYAEQAKEFGISARDAKSGYVPTADGEGSWAWAEQKGSSEAVLSVNNKAPDESGNVTLNAGDVDAYSKEQTDDKIRELNQYMVNEFAQVDEQLETKESKENKAETITGENIDATHYPSVKAITEWVDERLPSSEEKARWNNKAEISDIEEAEATLHGEIQAVENKIPVDLSQLNSDTTHRTVTDEQITNWDSAKAGIVVEIGSYQYSYQGKVLPAIPVDVLRTIYTNDKAGIPQVLHWTLYGTENNLKVVSSDSIAGNNSIDVLVHNQYHCEYVWGAETTGIVNPNIMSTEIPDATETVKGVIQLATESETKTGTNGTKAVTPKNLKTITDVIDEKIEKLQSAQIPNAVFVGEPSLVGSTVSGFTSTDYLIFPFVVDVRNKPFEIVFQFRTGNNVTTQQNILDSAFGLALAIRNGKGLMALSSNGTSFNIGQVEGTYTINANSVYYAKVSWDGAVYKTSISTDGKTYTDDMTLSSTAGLFPTTIYIGGSPDLFGAGTAHPFSGGIDMGESYLTVDGIQAWHGMDNAGLASRANVSLSNLDTMGEARFSEIKEDLASKVSDVRVSGASIVQDGVANVPIFSDSTPGVVKLTQNYGIKKVGSDGTIAVDKSDNDRIDRRISSYMPIVPTNLDYAVKCAMCDGKGPAWTPAEQKASRERQGIRTMAQEAYDLLPLDERGGIIIIEPEEETT